MADIQARRHEEEAEQELDNRGPWQRGFGIAVVQVHRQKQKHMRSNCSK